MKSRNKLTAKISSEKGMRFLIASSTEKGMRFLITSSTENQQTKK